MKKKPKEYVNNKRLHEELCIYKDQVKHASENDLPKPKISNYIGECILKIATNLSNKSNFVNYSYKDDMISDAIENCLMYIDNFQPFSAANPTQPSNAFAYLTQIAFFAFVRRIQKEKKHQYIKAKSIQFLQTEIDLINNGESGSMTRLEATDLMNDLVEKFEESKEKKKQKAKPKGLENFIE